MVASSPRGPEVTQPQTNQKISYEEKQKKEEIEGSGTPRYNNQNFLDDYRTRHIMVYSMVIVVFLALAGSYVSYHHNERLVTTTTSGLFDNFELLIGPSDYCSHGDPLHHGIRGTRV